ncbi:MAG: FecR domain-containing protein [Chitinophagaceae bacterium]
MTLRWEGGHFLFSYILRAFFMKENALQDLLLKYLDGRLSAQEVMELADRVAEIEDTAWNEVMIPIIESIQVNEPYEAAGWDEVFNDIIQHGQQKGKIVRFGIKKWFVAASVLLILVCGYWQMQRMQKTKKDTLQPQLVQGDILPGSFGATLTMADGSTIEIDSAVSGAIATQGNVEVSIKTGGLQYDATGTAQQQGVLYNQLTTGRGQTYHIYLQDGTEVWLNAASSIKYPVTFSDTIRRVELTGEGYFVVHHDAVKPFIVSVNGVEIKDLGTEFNVNAYEGQQTIRTTLIEGIIEVNGKRLRIHQQAVVNSNGTMLMKDDVNLEEVTAWKDGRFVFASADIHEILAQLSRWYNIDIVYTDTLPEKAIRGKASRNNRLSSLLKILESNGYKFSIEGKKIKVYSNE